MGGRGAPLDRRGFVLLEGTDGVGKTTVAESLGRVLDAAVLGLPPGFARFSRQIHLDEQPPSARLKRYLDAALQTAESVRTALASGHVVCDRFLISPVAALVAEDSLSEEEALEALSVFRPPTMPRPDLALLLVTDHATSVRRVAGRRNRTDGLSIMEARSAASPAFYLTLEDAIRRLSRKSFGSVTELDTTDLTVEQMCRAASELVTETWGLHAVRA